jgi:hypothetical protein
VRHPREIQEPLRCVALLVDTWASAWIHSKRVTNRYRRMRVVRRLVALVSASLVFAWMTAGVAFAEEWKGKSEVKRNSSHSVELIIPAEGLKVGENNLAVQLRDNATGQPVVRDAVRVDLLMDETDTSMKHGDMSQLEPVTLQLSAVTGSPGRYLGQADLSDEGTWKVRVFADDRGIQAPVTFTVSVAGGGPNWLVIAGLLALVALAIGGVLVLKRRSTPAVAASPALEASEA